MIKPFFQGLQSLWGYLEPLLFVLPFIQEWIQRNYSRLTDSQMRSECKRALPLIYEHMERHRIYFDRPSEDQVVRYLQHRLTNRNGMFVFKEGHIHHVILERLLAQFDRHRISKFLILLFMLRHGFHRQSDSIIFWEKALRLLRQKDTVFHYLAIPNALRLSYTGLLAEISKVESPSRADFPELSPSYDSLNGSKPRILRAIDLALSSGSVTEEAVVRLSSSHRILFVLKYAEGFQDVYNFFEQQHEYLKTEIQRIEKMKRPSLSKRDELRELRLARQHLFDNWVRAPLNEALEEQGFSKLFAHMDGVYLQPLSSLPESYQQTPQKYIDEIIIPAAEKKLTNARAIPSLAPHLPDRLHYIILFRVLTVGSLERRTAGRNLSSASRKLFRSLLSSYLSEESSPTRNILLSDILENVDFFSLLNAGGKTANSLIESREQFKQIVQDCAQINLDRPLDFGRLGDSKREEIIAQYVAYDSSIRPQDLRRIINEQSAFYRDLAKEMKTLSKQNVKGYAA